MNAWIWQPQKGRQPTNMVRKSTNCGLHQSVNLLQPSWGFIHNEGTLKATTWWSNTCYSDLCLYSARGATSLKEWLHQQPRETLFASCKITQEEHNFQEDHVQQQQEQFTWQASQSLQMESSVSSLQLLNSSKMISSLAKTDMFVERWHTTMIHCILNNWWRTHP